MQNKLYTEQAVGKTFYSLADAWQGILKEVRILEVNGNFLRYISGEEIGMLQKGCETMLLVSLRSAEQRIARYQKFFR